MADQEDNTKKPAVIPGKGFEQVEQVANAKKRETNFPGGEENAAGADAKERSEREQEGSQPVSSESLNKGNH